jgi:16S rRNA (uracil1498-N3)-methyltransferase
MTLPVHLVPSLDGVSAGATVEVTGDEAHHAVAVRRLQVGEELVLTDGRGTSARGQVASTGKRVFAVSVAHVESEPAPTPAITVVQALAKGDRGELAVAMLTEIGVAEIVPWAASRSVAVWRGERAEKSHAKWVATARESAKQARRSWFPTVAPLASTAQVAALLADAELSVVLHEDATLPLAALEVPESGRIVVVVGPEGGIPADELELLASPGARPVRLGDEVLRTSTAGVVACAALLARTSRWD